jgi:N-acetylglucosaminyldiphosphoundecaprenol N-acetyl-beta-D-mannosaminyltransferase
MEQALDKSRYIVGMRVDGSDYEKTVPRILSLAQGNCGAYVCVATVHMVMEAYDDPQFRSIVNGSDIVTSDGMPLVWGLRMLGVKDAQRVYGPDLTLFVCEQAAHEGIPLGFYGGSPPVLDRLLDRLRSRYPRLRIAYCCSPPFRELSAEEKEHILQAIRESGAKILFIGLGCPKQERWMAEHKEKIEAVMIGVGAAFDFIAASKPKAPHWIQMAGLEWLFRLGTEPRRLWKRYLYQNPRFLYYFTLQLLRSKEHR